MYKPTHQLMKVLLAKLLAYTYVTSLILLLKTLKVLNLLRTSSGKETHSVKIKVDLSIDQVMLKGIQEQSSISTH